MKPPFGLLSPISSIIVRDRHDKTLRIFFYFSDRLSLAISVVVLIFSIFRLNMAVFAFLRYVMSQFVFFLKVSFKIFQPLSHQYAMTKASNVVFVLRRKVPLCQSGGMAHNPRSVPFNVHIDGITPGYCQLVFQFSIINFKNRIRKLKFIYSTSTHRVS